MEKQTAGRKALGDFAPQFAALNDDVLFGEVWAKEMELSPKLRSIATVSALVDKGIAGDALRYHLQTAKKHGITKEEMAALLTHLAFYCFLSSRFPHFRRRNSPSSSWENPHFQRALSGSRFHYCILPHEGVFHP
ncbi:MAG: carboxymuconolactone decarboxylase family protein, partial [Selenomonas bovis]|nr:carboxymuconolactone decarboxylase family protein [Selenomonas bovis]